MERRSFIKGLFAVPAGVALVQATGSDLMIPDRQIVTPVEGMHLTLRGSTIHARPSMLVYDVDGNTLGLVTDVMIRNEEVDVTAFGEHITRYMPGPMRGEMTVTLTDIPRVIRHIRGT